MRAVDRRGLRAWLDHLVRPEGRRNTSDAAQAWICGQGAPEWLHGNELSGHLTNRQIHQAVPLEERPTVRLLDCQK
jgi:hypothetical protein